MKIIYDDQIFWQQRYGGISRYFCELASHVGRVPDVRASIVAPNHRNEYLRRLPFGTRVGWAAEAWKPLGRLRGLGARAVIHSAMATVRPDVLHETHYSESPWTAPLKTARVTTIHDMIHERLAGPQGPEHVVARAKRLAAERADHIICVSESTRQDVMSILGIPAEKLSVIHLAARLPPAHEAADIPGAPYLLYVGHREGYKNFMGFIAAVGASPILRDLQIVCFGGGPLTSAERARIAESGVQQAQILMRVGDDADLAALYAGALCFVYPSLLEGFGIPPLEALLCDCPVACSDTSSIPEVVRNAGAYFEPSSVDSMRLTLEDLVTSATRRDELRVQGRIVIRQYSWDRCAAETLAVYRRISEEKRGRALGL